MQFKIDAIGFHYYEKNDCIVKRPNGSSNYLFLFFATEAYVEINQTLITIPPNTCIIYSPTYPQLYYNDKDGFLNDWFHFSGENIDSFFDTLRLPLNSPFQIRNYGEISLFIKILEVEYIKKDICWEDAIHSIITNNFIKIAREYHHQANYRKNPYKTDLLEKFKIARVEILTNYQKSWNIDEMAALVNLSRSRFSILYKEFFQISPKEDLIRERIKKAQYLLSTHTMNVSSVAYAVGYENICHFNRQFKKFASISPTAFQSSPSIP